MPGVGRAGEPEKLYRACMRARGWERVLVGAPDRSQFRGPEDAVTLGQGTTHNDATTAIACRQPRAARSPGVVGSPR